MTFQCTKAVEDVRTYFDGKITALGYTKDASFSTDDYAYYTKASSTIGTGFFGVGEASVVVIVIGTA